MSCSNFLFWPDKNRVYITPDYFKFEYENVYITGDNDITLHGWKIFPKKDAGNISVLFLHGNGQNISTHFINTLWMANNGITVYAFDYRGYGFSEGEPAFPEVMQDLRTMFNYVAENEERIIIFGQSLGAALAINFVGQNADVRSRISGLILDAPFSDFEKVTQEILAKNSVTWLFQYPLSLTMPGDRYDPIGYIQAIDIPVILFHSVEDQIVDIDHAHALLKKKPDMTFVETKGMHTATFSNRKNAEAANRFISEATGLSLEMMEFKVLNKPYFIK